jgi:hypothetical protein
MTTTDQPQHSATPLDAWHERATQAEQQVVTLTDQVRVLTADLQVIAASLRDEAYNRDWCGEYGNWIDNLNPQLSQPWMEHCSRTHTLTFSVTVSVDTRDLDNAVEMIRNELSDEGMGDDETTVNSIDVSFIRSVRE